MSDQEDGVPPRTLTRLQGMRDELEREQEARAELLARYQALEAELRRLQTSSTQEQAPDTAHVSQHESEEREGSEEKEGEEVQVLLKPRTAEETMAQKPWTPSPYTEHGLESLTNMYQAMGASHRLQGVTLNKPKSFSGIEVTTEPYALTHWYREVSCWVQSYATQPTQQVVLALQTLTGTARIMMENIIMADGNRVQDLPTLYTVLKDTFQRRDPGPDAWKEFQRARMRSDSENVVRFLNRLLLLSFVVNMSSDPTCVSITESDIATKLRTGLPYSLGTQVEHRFQLLVELGQTPDITPWGIAAAALRIESQTITASKNMARQQKYTVRTPPPKTREAVVNALPGSNKTDNANLPPSGRSIKRFAELLAEHQRRIVQVQTQLRTLPIGAKLTAEQMEQCRSNSLCSRCRRYGHDAKRCRHTSPMIPKN